MIHAFYTFQHIALTKGLFSLAQIVPIWIVLASLLQFQDTDHFQNCMCNFTIMNLFMHFTFVGGAPGFNCNVPFDKAAGPVGDAEYMYVWRNLLYPMATAFEPDLIIVSAGK